jgi:hypothetical protein
METDDTKVGVVFCCFKGVSFLDNETARALYFDVGKEVENETEVFVRTSILPNDSDTVSFSDDEVEEARVCVSEKDTDTTCISAADGRRVMDVNLSLLPTLLVFEKLGDVLQGVFSGRSIMVAADILVSGCSSTSLFLYREVDGRPWPDRAGHCNWARLESSGG